jgi:hypothetical protein
MRFLNKALSKLIPSFHSVGEWMVIYEELLHMKGQNYFKQAEQLSQDKRGIRSTLSPLDNTY